MIYGVGIDLVAIARLDKIVQRWGDKFTDKIFTDQEIVHCKGKREETTCLASRFAAKEAFSKALGKGMTEGITFKDIEIISDPQGKPTIKAHNRVLEFCRKKNIKHIAVSLSSEREIVSALVVLEM